MNTTLTDIVITADEWTAEADRLKALPVRTIAQEDAMRSCRVRAYQLRLQLPTFDVRYTLGDGTWTSTIQTATTPTFTEAAALIAARRTDNLPITVHSVTRKP